MHILLGMGWVLYGIIHSFLAQDNIKRTLQVRFQITADAYRVWYNILASVLLILMIFYQLRITSILLFKNVIVSRVISMVLLITGGSIMIICVIKYFRQFSGFNKNVKQELQLSGVHSRVRHPLYFGTFILLTGIFLWRPLLSNAIATVIIILYTVAGIYIEEKKLILIYGNQYREYQKRVPKIIPRFRNRERIVK